MKIMDSHSHLAGLEYLMVNEPQLWNEVTAAVEGAESNDGIRDTLMDMGWKPAGTRILKRRVSLEIPELPPDSGIAALYPLQLAGYAANEIDVGIELLRDNDRFEFALKAIRLHGRSTPAVPLILIGIE